METSPVCLRRIEIFQEGKDYRINDDCSVEIFFRVKSAKNIESKVYIELENMTFPKEDKIVCEVHFDESIQKLVAYPWGSVNSTSPKIIADDYLEF